MDPKTRMDRTGWVWNDVGLFLLAHSSLRLILGSSIMGAINVINLIDVRREEKESVRYESQKHVEVQCFGCVDGLGAIGGSYGCCLALADGVPGPSDSDCGGDYSIPS